MIEKLKPIRKEIEFADSQCEIEEPPSYQMLINKINEMVDFLNQMTEAQDLDALESGDEG